MTIMTVRAPDDLQNKLKMFAGKQGLTRNALILQILWEWVKRQERTGQRDSSNWINI